MLFETGPDVMSREAAERQARTAGLCEGCRMREAQYGFRTGWLAERRDHPVLPVLPVGAGPPAGRAGKTRRSGWPKAGRHPGSLAPGRHAGDPARPAAARPDRGAPRAGRRRARPSTGPAEGHRKSCQPGFPGSPRQAKACIASLTVHASLVGESERTAPKRRGRSTRGWKKLHFGVDGSGVIVADVLTDGRVDDATTGIALIEAVGGDVASVTAHPAYDTIAIYEAAGARGTTVVVPPTKAATATRYLLDKH